MQINKMQLESLKDGVEVLVLFNNQRDRVIVTVAVNGDAEGHGMIIDPTNLEHRNDLVMHLLNLMFNDPSLSKQADILDLVDHVCKGKVGQK